MSGTMKEQGLRRFKPYPEYKGSGVEWLGEIPAHWEVTPLKHVANFINGFGFKPDEWGLEGIPIIRIENLNGVENFNCTTRKLPATYCADKGDLLFGWSGNRGTSFGPFLWWRDGTHYVNQHIFRVVDFGVDKPWMYWTLRGVTFYVEKQAHGIIGMVHVTRGELGSIPIPVLLRHEQEQIAEFLEREHARIDGLVAKKEQLIELLQEKRAALITRAVTKGLDPSVPLKDSGVEWLGQIPAHWDVKPLKHLVPGLTVGIVVTPAKYYVDEGVPCLRSLNIVRGHIDMNNLVSISPEANEQHRKSKIREGDVLVVRTGQAGAAAVVPPDLDGANCIDLLIIRRSQQLRPWFLYYYFNSQVATSQAELTSVGAIQAHYNTSTLSELLVPLVPVQEQSAIEEYLDEHTQMLDRLVAKVREAIELLKEQRTALISAAVTGKIDVRAA